MVIFLEELKTIIELFGLLGTIFLSFGLIVSGIIRWMRGPDKDISKRRRNIVSWIAFAVICIMFVAHFELTELHRKENYGTSTEAVVLQESEEQTNTLNGEELLMENENGETLEGENRKQNGSNAEMAIIFNTVRTTMGLLMFGTVAFSVLLLLLFGIFFLYHVMCIVFQSKNENKNKVDGGVKIRDDFVNMIGLPIIRVFVAWGILALFLIFPFVVGERSDGSPIESWQNGINNIVSLLNTSQESEAGIKQALPSYMLLYIIVLGVGFAVIKLLSIIIGHAFEKRKEREIIEEYSGSIALLVIGVALLWTFQGNDHSELIIDVSKSLVTVMVIITLIILSLEIIRLLMDMKEKLIRKEARYVFIALIGQCAMVLVSILNLLFGAVNSVIGSLENTKMDEVEKRLREKMVEAIDKQIDSKGAENRQESNSSDGTFPAFEERITKK